MKNPVFSIMKRLTRLRRFPQISRTGESVFILDPQNWIDNRLLANVPYEREQLAFAKHLIAKKELTLFIDVGANFGLYTVVLGHLDAIKRVMSFEPVRRNFNQLCGNIFANRLDAKVEAFACALGASPMRKTIHIDPTSTGISRLDLTTTARNLQVFLESEEIDIQRGDAVLTIRNARIFMKIDVEGHTLEVLNGLQDFLDSCTGALQVEMDESEETIITNLAKLGWHSMKRIQGDTYFEKN